MATACRVIRDDRHAVRADHGFARGFAGKPGGVHVSGRMKIGRKLLGLALGLLAVNVGTAAVEFSGFLQVGGRPLFVLRDRAAGATSDWIGVGQAFEGYQLVGYEARRGVLTVRKSGRIMGLVLDSAHTVPAAPPLPPELVARGITPADLVVRAAGLVRISLSVGARRNRRFIDVHFDDGRDRCGVEFGQTGPSAIQRWFVPEAVRSWVSDADIAAINAHLAVVRSKWLPEEPDRRR